MMLRILGGLLPMNLRKPALMTTPPSTTAPRSGCRAAGGARLRRALIGFASVRSGIRVSPACGAVLRAGQLP